MFQIPLALIVFNRPELTRGLLDCLRPIRPKRLFLVADAARPEHEGDAEKVARTGDALSEIDWPCDITPIFADQSLARPDSSFLDGLLTRDVLKLNLGIGKHRLQLVNACLSDSGSRHDQFFELRQTGQLLKSVISDFGASQV